MSYEIPPISRDAFYTYACFLDVQQAWVETSGHRQHFHQAWLVTNTKVTSRVRDYAARVGMEVISWDYPLTVPCDC